MPKKTKKQKILANLHRQKQLFKQASMMIQKSPLKVKTKNKTIEEDYQKGLNNQDALLKKYFIGDIKKSLIIIIFVIALEIVFYFANLIK